MTPEEMKLGYRSHKEWLEPGNSDVVDEIFAEECTVHNSHIPPESQRGREAFKAYGAALKTAFPDLKITHDKVVTEGNQQAIRWTFEGTHNGEYYGIPATGKRVSITGIDVFRIIDGKITDLWLEQDNLSMMQQLGVVPSPQ